LREVVYVYSYYTRLSKSLHARINNLRAHNQPDAAAAMEILLARLTETRLGYRAILYQRIAHDPFMRAARGVLYLNGIMVAELFSTVDIERASSPAALWAFCGLAVVWNTSQLKARALGAAKVTWNPAAARAIGSLRKYILAKKCPYRPIYDKRRLYELHRGYKPVVAHRRALRYAVKLWLKHAWIVMRLVHGLPLGNVHADDKLADPTAFGWELPVGLLARFA